MGKRKLPSFNLLFANYPEDRQPCKELDQDGNIKYENQCALRVSVCLEKSGFKLVNNDKKKCKHGHIRGAESLGRYLHKQSKRPKVYKNPAAGAKQIGEKMGIILFRNIDGFRGGQGDHIDLWIAGKTMTGDYSAHCQEIKFWELN